MLITVTTRIYSKLQQFQNNSLSETNKISNVTYVFTGRFLWTNRW